MKNMTQKIRSASSEVPNPSGLWSVKTKSALWPVIGSYDLLQASKQGLSFSSEAFEEPEQTDLLIWVWNATRRDTTSLSLSAQGTLIVHS